MQNLILPMDNALSLTANGLLAVMLNCPEKDYRTIDEIYEMSNDSLETIGKAIHELLDAEYLISVEGKFAVNKVRIPEMKVIKSAKKHIRTYHVTT